VDETSRRGAAHAGAAAAAAVAWLAVTVGGIGRAGATDVVVAKGSAATPLQAPALASGPKGHAVAWVTGSLKKGFELTLAFVDAGGKVGKKFSVAKAKGGLAPAVAADGDGYALAWTEGPATGADLKVSFFKHGDKPAAPKTLASSLDHPDTPIVTAGPSGVLVGWINAPEAKSRFYAVTLPSGGGAPSATLEVSEGAPPGAHWAAGAWDGKFYLLAWYDDVAKNVWVRYFGADGKPATDAMSIKGGQHVRSLHLAMVGLPFLLWEYQAKDGCWDVATGPVPVDPKDLVMDPLEGPLPPKGAKSYDLPAGMRWAAAGPGERIVYLKAGERCVSEAEMMGEATPAVELRAVAPGAPGAAKPAVLHRWEKASPVERGLTVYGGAAAVVWYDYPTVSLKLSTFPALE
jgi:hypothetical protein